MSALWRACWMLLALRCKESTELLSAECDRTLGHAERWALRLHFINCIPCRRFQGQLVVIQGLVRGRTCIPAQLSSEARQKISARLREEIARDPENDSR